MIKLTSVVSVLAAVFFPSQSNVLAAKSALVSTTDETLTTFDKKIDSLKQRVEVNEALIFHKDELIKQHARDIVSLNLDNTRAKDSISVLKTVVGEKPEPAEQQTV